MEVVVQNVKFALRSLIKRPAFAVVVLTTLALGIGGEHSNIQHPPCPRFAQPASQRARSTGGREPEPASLPYPLFRHFQQHNVRTAGDPMALASVLRKVVGEIDPHTPVSEIRTVEVGRSLLRERLVAAMTTLFGGLALMLVVLGIYGVLSYGVVQRTRELGIRMALGATAGTIRGLVLREAAWVLGVGTVLSLGLVWPLSRVANSLLFEVSATETASTAAAIVVLLSVGALGAWIPARRASHVEPIRALKYD